VTGSSIAAVRTKSTFLNPLLPYSFLPLENVMYTKMLLKWLNR